MGKNLLAGVLLMIGIASLAYALSASIDHMGDVLVIAAQETE